MGHATPVLARPSRTRDSRRALPALALLSMAAVATTGCQRAHSTGIWNRSGGPISVTVSYGKEPAGLNRPPSCEFARQETGIREGEPVADRSRWKRLHTGWRADGCTFTVVLPHGWSLNLRQTCRDQIELSQGSPRSRPLVERLEIAHASGTTVYEGLEASRPFVRVDGERCIFAYS